VQRDPVARGQPAAHPGGIRAARHVAANRSSRATLANISTSSSEGEALYLRVAVSHRPRDPGEALGDEDSTSDRLPRETSRRIYAAFRGRRPTATLLPLWGRSLG